MEANSRGPGVNSHGGETNDSAEVIKIENPKSGDDTRAWGPPFAKALPEYATSTYHGESAYFLSVRELPGRKLTEGQSE